MKLSDLIAKGRRTVLKISPPKNPRKFTGAVIRKAGQLSAARGRRTASALIPADADPALPPDFAALDTCAASWQCLPAPPRDPALRLPTPAQAGAAQEANPLE